MLCPYGCVRNKSCITYIDYDYHIFFRRDLPYPHLNVYLHFAIVPSLVARPTRAAQPELLSQLPRPAPATTSPAGHNTLLTLGTRHSTLNVYCKLTKQYNTLVVLLCHYVCHLPFCHG